MIRDINPPVVKDVAVAIVPEKNEFSEEIWNVYLLNFQDLLIEGVLVSSKGYGEIDGEKVKTSVLRHFLDTVKPHSYALIEPIIKDVFPLSNEYWVSFYLNKELYDKKFIFLPETVNEDYFINIPLIKKRGVMIR